MSHEPYIKLVTGFLFTSLAFMVILHFIICLLCERVNRVRKKSVSLACCSKMLTFICNYSLHKNAFCSLFFICVSIYSYWRETLPFSSLMHLGIGTISRIFSWSSWWVFGCLFGIVWGPRGWGGVVEMKGDGFSLVSETIMQRDAWYQGAQKADFQGEGRCYTHSHCFRCHCAMLCCLSFWLGLETFSQSPIKYHNQRGGSCGGYWEYFPLHLPKSMFMMSL